MTSQSFSLPPSSSSDASPMPRHPSPLAHSVHSPEEVASPSSVRSAPLPSQSTQSVRSRGGSVSTIRPLVTSPVITRVVSTPVSHSLSSSTATLGPGQPDFRSRSLSRSRRASSASRHHSPVRDLSWLWRFKNAKADGDSDDSASWWTSVEVIPRPWDEKRKKTVPVEQAEGYVRTRDVSVSFSFFLRVRFVSIPPYCTQDSPSLCSFRIHA